MKLRQSYRASEQPDWQSLPCPVPDAIPRIERPHVLSSRRHQPHGSYPMHRGLFMLTVGIVCGVSACRDRVSYHPRLDEDEITHLAVHRADAPEGVWVRIGHPEHVCTFHDILRRATPMPPRGAEHDAADNGPRFFVKWASGREMTCTVSQGRLLRFWHLATVLDEREDDFLNELLEAVRHEASSWPSGVVRPAAPDR